MSAISYAVSVGGNLDTVTAGTNIPTGGNGTIEIRLIRPRPRSRMRPTQAERAQ